MSLIMGILYRSTDNWCKSILFICFQGDWCYCLYYVSMASLVKENIITSSGKLQIETSIQECIQFIFSAKTWVFASCMKVFQKMITPARICIKIKTLVALTLSI